MAKKEIKGVLNEEIKMLMTPEAIKDLGALNPTVQQFLLRFTDLREKVLSDKLKEELKDFMYELYNEDNDRICKNVAEIVSAQNDKLFKFFTDIEAVISTIASDINTIKEDILKIYEHQQKTDERIMQDEIEINKLKARLDQKKLRLDQIDKRFDAIHGLENAAKKFNEFDGRLLGVEKNVKEVEEDVRQVVKHTNIYWEFVRVSGIVIIFVSAIGAFIMYGHNIGWW